MFLILISVSEAVCKEYEQLKRQYDVETGAMHKAMQQASQVCSSMSFSFIVLYFVNIRVYYLNVN